jgi:hypothetical protein
MMVLLGVLDLVLNAVSGLRLPVPLDLISECTMSMRLAKLFLMMDIVADIRQMLAFGDK